MSINNLSVLVKLNSKEKNVFSIIDIEKEAELKKEKAVKTEKEKKEKAVKEKNKNTSNNTMELLEAIDDKQLYAQFRIIDNTFYDMLASLDTDLCLKLKNSKDLKEYYEIVNGYINNISNNNVNTIPMYAFTEKELKEAEKENNNELLKASKENITLYQFNEVEKLLIFHTAYIKAVFNKSNMNWKNVKYIDNNGTKTYIEKIKHEALINKNYAFTNNTNVENFPIKNNTYQEILDKIVQVPFVDRINTNCYNQCFTDIYTMYKDFNKKGYISLINKKKNNCSKIDLNNLHFSDIEEKIISYRRLIVRISLQCVNSIIKSHFEGLKGSYKRNEMYNNFVSLYSEVENSKSGKINNLIDMIADTKECFSNIALELNLKDILTKEEAKIFYSLCIGMPQRKIMEKLGIANRKITKVKEKVLKAYQQQFITKEVNGSKYLLKKVKKVKVLKVNCNIEKIAILLRIRKMLDSKIMIDTNNFTINNNKNYSKANIIDNYINKGNRQELKEEYSDINNLPISVNNSYDFSEYNDYNTGKRENYIIRKRTIAKTHYASSDKKHIVKFFENKLDRTSLKFYASRIHCE